MTTFLSFGSTLYVSDNLPIITGEWNHVMFAYRHIGETVDLAFYVNFSSQNPNQLGRNTTQRREVVPERLMRSGGERNLIGIMDDLLIFREFLSPSQMAQLNQTYSEM